MGHFSGMAGAVALAVMVDSGHGAHDRRHADARTQHAARGGGRDLACPDPTSIRQIAYRAAKAGIVTGFCSPIARISGETGRCCSPRSITSFEHQSQCADVELPAVIFQFALSPYQDWQD